MAKISNIISPPGLQLVIEVESHLLLCIRAYLVGLIQQVNDKRGFYAAVIWIIED